MGRTPWGDHGHHLPSRMKIWLILKTVPKNVGSGKGVKMEKKNKLSSEQGQVLVLVVLGFVVLLGFVALAIDGSMVYSDRRFAQNASDASSLAGGGAAALSMENSYVEYPDFSCSDPAVTAAQTAAKLAAVGRASSNTFSIDTNISDQHGVTTSCGQDDNGSWIDKYIDINTWITSDTKSTFAHFVYAGPLRNTVDSVVRVRPRTSLAFGYAVAAIREDCPNSSTGGVHFDGTSDLTVNGGGIFSNACIVAGGTVDVDVNGAEIVCTGSNCYTSNGGPSVSPAPDSGNLILPEAVTMVPPPDCSLVPLRGSHTGGGTIPPGRYTDIRVNSSADVLSLQSGLYCLSGDFKANGGTIDGDGVTLYLTSGDFDVAGGVQINLKAPPSRTCQFCPPPLPGVLIYLADGNTGEASLLGTSDSEYLGLVYAPSGTIEAGGTGSELSEIHAQLIAGTVKLHGTTDVVINFDDEQNYSVPSMIELYK
jgi:Putative Flp pilus-assembly TadE/G-like